MRSYRGEPTSHLARNDRNAVNARRVTRHQTSKDRASSGGAPLVFPGRGPARDRRSALAAPTRDDREDQAGGDRSADAP